MPATKTKPAKVHPLRDNLLDAIAEFVVTDEGRKSIELEMGKPDAKAWAKVRNLLGVRGWGAEKKDAVTALKVVLGIKD